MSFSRSRSSFESRHHVARYLTGQVVTVTVEGGLLNIALTLYSRPCGYTAA